ncbi:cytochrome c [bacterium]|nr:MAG: cytochrome c [bacterium]
MKHIFTALLFLALISCGNSDESHTKKASASKTNASGISDFELKNGIGPVKEEVKLGALNQTLVNSGKAVFELNCSACHKTSERYVGPQLDDMLTRRTPTYLMNMMLNPDEMIKKHPEGKKMFAQFLTPMPKQNITLEQARSIVEYIRTVQK